MTCCQGQKASPGRYQYLFFIFHRYFAGYINKYIISGLVSYILQKKTKKGSWKSEADSRAHPHSERIFKMRMGVYMKKVAVGHKNSVSVSVQGFELLRLPK